MIEEKKMTEGEEKKSLSFVEQMVEGDLSAGKNGGRIQTRFPPEPNGYIHIGHAKAICMDFGVAEKFGGICNLRFDDTNPTKENTEYVENIMNDIKWLGFHWENVYYASDYFDKLWDFAIWLIEKGLAYVDEQTSEQIAEQKGTPTQAGRPSPFRDRPIEENLRLFRQMNTPEAVEGSMVLRAKLDMANPNMHFRDPIIYRIIQIPHHRTGTKWHCYPMYDFAHGQSDYFEGVTHSICTLEFVPHRPLYDKFVDFLQEKEGQTAYRPRQIEFNRLNLTYTVMSKRKLKALVDEGLVDGWSDPRMPTVCGMRRRGYSAQSIRNFIKSIGYTKFDALNDYALLEAAVRDDLNKKACRVSAVLNPVKLVITNYPEGKTEQMEAVNNPENEADGKHTITFSRELWIERDDFMEIAEKKFMRLAPGKEVRLKNAYIIKCDEEYPCDKDAEGNVTTIYATYDPETRSGQPGADRKIKGKTLHWLSCQNAVPAEVRLYDRLFSVENPGADERDFRELLNPDSLTVLQNCYVEQYLTEKKPGDFLQFQRIGYFTLDESSKEGHLIFNKTVGLKDTWAKMNK
ncbi:glutamine--tRNA ligase/YqeY domain fusion protein [Prevotella sp. tf2-5]|uniref:glutamine--tRNA ligase/YqeY domain fusion protein n=1 Tax=Prevotella sp. tf2-5 TaxID=1761889 RepID=UPI0008F10AAB|nr:glutamine--tRNA ligase/YqeY domain fusion protein [Prevotella sp. tf2-5]SFO53558.1 glutaminyl-tRNA synthetase [Prevotella sp. tf2-5]